MVGVMSDEARNGRPRYRARRRDEMLRAAARVFADIGLRQATMEDIARELKTSKIALYRYFPTKNDLIDALLSQHADTFVTAEHRPWSGLKRAVRQALVIGRDNPAAFLLMTRAAANDPELQSHFGRVRQAAEEATRRRLRLLDHPVVSDPLMLDVLARGLIAFLFSSLADWIERGVAERDGDWVRYVASVATRMVDLPGSSFGTLPPVLADDELT